MVKEVYAPSLRQPFAAGRQVTGYAFDDGPSRLEDAFVFSGGRMLDVGRLAEVESYGVAINSNG